MGGEAGENPAAHHHAVGEKYPSPETRTPDGCRAHIAADPRLAHEHHAARHRDAAAVVHRLHTTEAAAVPHIEAGRLPSIQRLPIAHGVFQCLVGADDRAA